MNSHSTSSSKTMELMVVFFGVITVVAATAEQEAKYAGNLPYEPKEEDEVLNCIKQSGYTAEDHIVETEDGYLLTVHRIVNESGPPLFIQHGLLSSSEDWLTIGERRQLPYMLADLGYDVWLGNYRGNKFSHAHAKLSTMSQEYWDFSWHEMGIHDLPAMIDYVLSHKADKSEKIIYIGHSMGTTGSFVMSAERPDMHDKIKLIISLAPVAYMTHIKSPLRVLAPFTVAIEAAQKITHDYDLFSEDELGTKVLRAACTLNTVNSLVCTSVLFAICGYDPEQIDYDQVKIIASRTVAGASTKSLVHYLQEVNSREFRQYDYRMENMQKYGALSPPEYDISKMVIPMAFFYGDNDWLAAVEDVSEFYKKLPKGVALERINSSTFNHLGFLWAKDAVELVYEPVIELIQNFD